MSQSHVRENSSSSNLNSFNTNSFNVFVNNLGGADERSEILAWLSPLDPRIRHDDIRSHRVEDVGEWLLRTEEYRNWFDGIRGGEFDNSALFCYGAPGVGKTYISSLVVDTLCDWARGQNVAVACFYFDFAAPKEQSPTSILGSLLKQVVGGLEDIPEKIVQAFRDQKKVIGGRKLGLSEIIQMLQDISSSRPTFICIDALDECVVEYREKLLDSLRQILQGSSDTRIFMAGRLHIQGEVEKHLAGRVAVVSISPAKDDIIRFLRAKLGEDTTPDAIDESLEEDIIKNIPETVSEIFLLVSLNIKAILRETTIYRRREKLSSMTNGLGLGDAYDATIRRIKAQEGDRARLGMATLMWISHSERPLRVDEICHALAIEIESTHFNTNNVPSIRTVLSCCQGLVAVNKGSSTVRLIHFTLKEYLSGHPDLFGRAHSKIAEACLTYLNLQTINDLSARASRDLPGPHFLEYSSLYWGTHMRMELSDRSRYLALELLDQYDSHISAKVLRESIWGFFTRPFSYHPLFSALHCVSYFGIGKVAVDLIKMKRWDVNQRDSAGVTPLIWAARYGHEEVVRLLLQQMRTEPDMPDTRYNRTALSWAAGNGHEGVVRLFLGRPFVNPLSNGRWWGRRPQVMSLLFGRRCVNPDRPDNWDQTPLLRATRHGHSGVVKLLLDRADVNPDRPDKWGQTPLLWAAENGHYEVAKLLLGRGDVGPDRLDQWGQTPLSQAARNGHERVVELLLGREDVNPNKLDELEQTPLLRATRYRHSGVVKLLLDRADVNPDMPDNRGQTPLTLAAGNGDEGVVRLLLDRVDVNPDNLDKRGQTPLLQAVRNGLTGVVRLLLVREDVNPDRPDRWGRAPLSLAATSGHDGVAELLLGREDVDPRRLDEWGQTPLSLATKYGHGGVVRLLEARTTIALAI